MQFGLNHYDFISESDSQQTITSKYFDFSCTQASADHNQTQIPEQVAAYYMDKDKVGFLVRT
jgi:hypothetical protein